VLRLGIEVLKKVDDSIALPSILPMGIGWKQEPLFSLLKGQFKVCWPPNTMLNFIQRLSGIAFPHKKVCRVNRRHAARIFDTRKTTPGFGGLEKWAVR
jgi:nicotinate-nucleotide pyrophosphorylase